MGRTPFSKHNPNGPNTPAGSRGWYRKHATTATGLAAKHRRTPWIMPQAYQEIWGPWDYDESGNMVILPGGIAHWRPPTAGEMRWQVFSGLAAGMQGLIWFCYAPPPAGQPDAEPYKGSAFPATMAVQEKTATGFSGALIRPDGSATEQYQAAAEAFGVLMKLRASLIGTVPCETPILQARSPGFCGMLRNPRSGVELCVVVNDDTQTDQVITLTGPAHGQYRDLPTQRMLRSGEDGTIRLTLRGGEGTVLEVVGTRETSGAR